MNKSRYGWIIVLLVLQAGLFGCSRSQSVDVATAPAFAPPVPEVQMAVKAMDRADDEPAAAPRQLSYSHDLAVALPAAQVRGAYQALIKSCSDAGEAACIVMHSSVEDGTEPTARLSLMVKRDHVEGLRQKATAAGKLIRQQTTAEDLGGPLVDVNRRLAMKKSLRDSLIGLRERSQSNLEALLKITEKLGEVQSEIEEAEGERAGLQNKLAMDRLAIEFHSEFEARSSMSSLGAALKNFGGNLSDGLASLITFVAYAAPWLILLLALPLLLRLMRMIWRWTRRVA